MSVYEIIRCAALVFPDACPSGDRAGTPEYIEKTSKEKRADTLVLKY